MSWLDNFPYTNFHELNLDWILKTIRQLLADWNQYKSQMNLAFQNLSEEFRALHDYVQDYFDNLDVQQEIDNKLNEMAEDGSLEQLLINIRDVDGQTLAIENMAIEDKSRLSDTYVQIQGMCINEDAGTFVYAMTKTRSDQYDQTDALLYKRNIDDFSLVHPQPVLMNLGHANGMAYDKFTDKIYIAYGPYTVSQPAPHYVGSNMIKVVDYASMALVTTVYVIDDNGDPVFFRDVTVDENGNVFVFNSADDGDYIAKVNMATGHVESKVKIPYRENSPRVPVNAKIYNNHLYVLHHAPNVLEVYGIDERNITPLKIYTMGDWIGDYLFLGETESMAFYHDMLYFTSFVWDTTRYDSCHISLHRCDPKRNVLDGLYATGWSVTSSVTHNIYCKRGQANEMSMENGTAEHPFKSLQRALDTLRNGNPYKYFNVYLDGTHPYSVANVLGAYVAISKSPSAESTPVIKGLRVTGAAGFTLQDVDVDSRGLTDIPAIYTAHISKVGYNNVSAYADDTYTGGVIESSFCDVFINNVYKYGGSIGVILGHGILYGYPRYYTKVDGNYIAKTVNTIRIQNYAIWIPWKGTANTQVSISNPIVEIVGDESFCIPSHINLWQSTGYSDPAGYTEGVIQLSNFNPGMYNAILYDVWYRKVLPDNTVIYPRIFQYGVIKSLSGENYLEIFVGSSSMIVAFSKDNNTITIVSNPDQLRLRSISAIMV